MAIAGATQWEVQTGGNDTNGGGFVAGAAGTDFSLVTGKRTITDTTDFSTTDAVANGTTTLTSATANFTAAIVGNIIYLQGGTGSLAITRRQVTARTNATTITVDATVATGTGITMNIGGCLASPGESTRNHTSGNTIWIKAGTYTIASSTPSVATGCISATGANVFGYQTTRGDFTSTRPLMQANGSITSFNMISLNSSGTCRGINLDGNNRGVSRGVLTSAQCVVMDCNAVNFTGTAFQTTASVGIRLLASACSTSTVFSISDGILYDCIAKDCTITAFTIGTSGRAVRCIADSCSGASSEGFSLGTGATAINCVAYLCGRDGFRVSAGSACINCLAEDNVVQGFNNSTGTNNALFLNCGAYSNATDFTIGTGNTGSFNLNSVVAANSFFDDVGNSIFSLNNVMAAGQYARETGTPSVSPDGATNSYIDMGYSQHSSIVGASSGGGSFTYFG